MLLEEMMKDERKAGRAEGLAEGLAKGRIEGLSEGRIGTILRQLSIKGFDSIELNEKISSISDSALLDTLTDAILTANSPEDLLKLIK